MAELFAFPPRLVPQHPTLAAYRDVLTASPLARYLLNSVKLVSATVLCALAIAVPSAYALSRLRFRRPVLKSLVMLGMLAVQLISPLVTALPLYRWFSALGLINSHAAVVLVYVALSAPLATWMLTGFLDTVPLALDEAARIDGCTRLQSLLRVLLPVMLPGLASTAILLAISTWGQFIVPFVLLTRGDLYPVSVGILDYQSSSELGEHASARRRRHSVGAAGDADIPRAATVHCRRADRGRGEGIAEHAVRFCATAARHPAGPRRPDRADARSRDRRSRCDGTWHGWRRFSNDAVGKVTAAREHAKASLRGLPIHIHVATRGDAPDGVGDFVRSITVGTLQHPGQFTEHDGGNRDDLAALDNSGGRFSLGFVVPCQVTHQHIGIDGDAQRRPASIASRISSSETGRCRRRRSMPLTSRRSWPADAEASSTRPSGNIDTPTFPPGLTPR